MDVSILLVWIFFLFCLGLCAGGILMLFRNRSFVKNSSFKFLQYAMILLYTFGFYSLWSQVFFRMIFNPTENQDLKILSDFIALIGTPFLLVGMVMFFMWGSSLLKVKPTKRSITFSFSLALFFTSGLCYIISPRYYLDISDLYAFLVLFFLLPLMFFMLTSPVRLLNRKAKYVIIFVILLFGIAHLLLIMSDGENYYFELVFNFSFFLIITFIEIYFLYSVEWQVLLPQADSRDENKSFDSFVEKYAITTRESEIILELLTGKTNKQIAQDLFISLQTVKDHNYRIYQKTNVKSRSQLASLLRNYQIDL